MMDLGEKFKANDMNSHLFHINGSFKCNAQKVNPNGQQALRCSTSLAVS